MCTTDPNVLAVCYHCAGPLTIPYEHRHLAHLRNPIHVWVHARHQDYSSNPHQATPVRLPDPTRVRVVTLVPPPPLDDRPVRPQTRRPTPTKLVPRPTPVRA